MPALVVAGAILRCSIGSAQGILQIQRSSSVNGSAHPVATTADKTGFQFGLCPNQGAPSPLQCVPTIPGPWLGSASVRSGGLPVLTTASTCHCTFGGTISVVSPGQSSISAG